MEEKKLYIILADDDEDDRMFFVKAINALTVTAEIITFQDGVELMTYLESDNAKMPDLIFLDMNMPKKDGMECLIEIKHNDELKNIPVAIYSTSSYGKNIAEAFINNADIYIKKLNTYDELKKVLEEVVNINWQDPSSGLNKRKYFS